MATRTVMLSSVYSKPFIWNVNGYTNGLAQWLKMTSKVWTSFWPPFAPYFFHQENWVQNVHVARKVTLLRVHQSVLETLFIRGYHVSPGSCWPLAWRFLVHHHQNKSSRETHKHWWWTSRSASRDEKCTKHASYHKKSLILSSTLSYVKTFHFMTTNFESIPKKKPRDNQNFFLFFSSLILWVRLRLATFWRCSKYHGFVFSLPYLTSRVLIGFGGRKNWLLLSDVTSWRSQGKIRLLFMTSTIMTYFSEVIKVKVMVLCHYYIDSILAGVLSGEGTRVLIS